MKISPFIDYHGLKWFFRKDLYTIQKYKWADSPESTSAVVKRILECGGISFGIQYPVTLRKRNSLPAAPVLEEPSP